MIVAGVTLLLLGYLLPLLIPVPLVLVTLAIWLGWILLITGAILWLLGSVRSQPVGRRGNSGSVGSWPVGPQTPLRCSRGRAGRPQTPFRVRR